MRWKRILQTTIARGRAFLQSRRRRIALLALLALLAARAIHRDPPLSPLAPAAAPIPNPVGIVFHHSESAAAYHGVRITAAALDRIHRRDHHWAVEYQGRVYHIGYHYVILPDGSWQKGRPDHAPGAHSRRHNNWLGICFVGNFDPRSRHYGEWPRRPTQAQTLAAIRLCEQLMVQYHIPPDRIKRHGDVNQTNCPGRRFPYRFILGQLRQYATAHPEITQRVALE